VMLEQRIKVLSVNISTEKGTVKQPVSTVLLDLNGVQQDAHSGPWHRQVSMLGIESVERFSREAKRKIAYGEFAENITTSGIELVNTMPLDRFMNDTVVLEVTQIGKKCHGSNCSIYREVGNCVMPREGIFARVIRGGELKPGDVMIYRPKVLSFLVVTLSDRASRGEYEDKSGPAIVEMIENQYKDGNRKIQVHHHLIPDDGGKLNKLLLQAHEEKVDFVITTGGTGIGPKDITIETVRPLLDKEIPGIMEMIRVKYGEEKPNALLSRGVAGLMGNTFIYTLPGSVKGVKEYMTEILKTNDHLVYMLNGLDAH